MSARSFTGVQDKRVRCWKWKEDDGLIRHNCDPRMMGSTEHNMGRVAHNAYVMEWILQQIEMFVEMFMKFDEFFSRFGVILLIYVIERILTLSGKHRA